MLSVDSRAVSHKQLATRDYPHSKEIDEERIFGEGNVDALCHELGVSFQGISGNANMLENYNKDMDRILHSEKQEQNALSEENNLSPELVQEIEQWITLQNAAIHSIETEVNKQKKMADGVLNVARLQAGKIKLNLSTVDPIRLIEEILKDLSEEAALKQVKLSLQSKMDKISVDADKEKVGLIFYHLILEAIQSAPKKGEVIISCLTPEVATEMTALKFSIEHNVMPQLLLEETQVEISSPESDELSEISAAGDIGLNFSISEKLIALMQGELKILNEKESSIKILFTIKCANTCKPHTPPKALVFSDAGNLLPLKTKVLIVEDNTVNQYLLKAQLSEKGYICKIAANGLDALALCQKEVFNVILMDQEMPLMDGMEASKLIRQNEAASPAGKIHTPIIMISAHDPNEERLSLILKNGVDDYLRKPYKTQELINKICALTNPASLKLTAAV